MALCHPFSLASCDACFTHQFIISLLSGMSRAVHPQESSEVDVDHCHMPGWASLSTFHPFDFVASSFTDCEEDGMCGITCHLSRLPSKRACGIVTISITKPKQSLNRALGLARLQRCTGEIARHQPSQRQAGSDGFGPQAARRQHVRTGLRQTGPPGGIPHTQSLQASGQVSTFGRTAFVKVMWEKIIMVMEM